MRPSDFWRHFAKPTLAALQAVGVFIAGVGVLLAAIQLHDNRQVESASLGLQFDDRLSNPSTIAIIDASESFPPLAILKEHGGHSTDDELESMLGIYDTLYYLHEDRLINDQMSYDLFCFDLKAVYGNPEVSTYLKQERREANDSSIYIGFDRVAAVCTQWDKSGRGSRLAQ
jgi:hypothetical protein